MNKSTKQHEAAPTNGQDALTEKFQASSGALRGKKTPLVADLLSKMDEIDLKLGYDRLADRPVKTGPLPWDPSPAVRAWREVDDARLYSMLQEELGLKKRGEMDIALTIFADERAFDPLVDLLESVPWDGEERAERLFIDYLGVEDSPYTRAATNIFLSEAVARAYKPGCKADYLVILAGEGGLGKSTLARKLALEDRFFSDCAVNLGDVKMTGELNRGKWIVELPELSGLSDRNLEAVKAAVTRQIDEFRGAYCRRTASHPRRVVYIGTTNETDFIRERTSGARRFLPLLCGTNELTKSVFVKDAKLEMLQIWAEARTWMERGDPRFSTVLEPDMEAEAAAQRACFMEEDPREQLINAYLAEREGPVCTFEVIDRVLRTARTRALCREVSAILSNRCPGWAPAGKRNCGEYGKQRCWMRR